LCIRLTTATHPQTNAHVGFDAWNLTTTPGGTIQAALDFTMTVPPGSEDAMELYPSIGAVAAVYGDRDLASGTSYTAFLASAQANYPAEPWFLWDQPLSDSGWVREHAGSAGAATPSGSSASASSTSKNGGTRVWPRTTRWVLGTVISVLLHVLLFV
jgi:hypothetical protein